MDRTYAFVDESGNSDLDTSKGGSSGFFIVCSILVAEKDLEAAYAQAEALRMRHFQTGEIKSSNLKPKDSDRRARILNELAELPFKLYFTVVDKSRIHKDGGLRIADSTPSGHPVRSHLARHSRAIWPPVPRPSGRAVGAQRRRGGIVSPGWLASSISASVCALIHPSD